MPKKLKCSRCHETFIQKYNSRFGQICPWCEESMIAAERELSRKCGILPMTRMNVDELNKHWHKKKAV